MPANNSTKCQISPVISVLFRLIIDLLEIHCIYVNKTADKCVKL